MKNRSAYTERFFFYSIPIIAFDHIQKLFKTVQILRRIIIDIDASLFIVSDQGNLGAEHAPHPLDKGQ